MSLTTATRADAAPPVAASRPPRGLLACAALACALVLASGAIRWWQARRVADVLAVGLESPFPLDSLPMTLGNWVGVKTELDSEIVARTGSNDLITRRYVNQTTGVAVELIVLHGPANEIFIHSPDYCYPRAGFSAQGEVGDREIRGLDGPVTFRSAAFTKGDPARPDTQEVYFSWRYNDHWATEVRRPREMQRVGGMFKVQVARRLQTEESRSVANPCEAFLELLVPVLEARIKGQPPTTRVATTPRSSL